MGRSTKLNKKIAKEICLAISQSDLGLVRLCEKNAHWPHRATILRWAESDEYFRELYRTAKEHQAHFLVDQTLEIADCSVDDEIIDEKGNVHLNKEFVRRSELRVKARQWAAERLAPVKYGVKITQQLEGGGKPVEVEHAGYVALIPVEADSIDEWQAGNLDAAERTTD